MSKRLQLTYVYEAKFYPLYGLSSRKRQPPVCDHQRLKARPNDRNISTQHITTLLGATLLGATLLGATCCVRLATMLGTRLVVKLSFFSVFQDITCTQELQTSISV